MVSLRHLARDWRHYASAGGLTAAAIAAIALMSLVWWYASPQEPNIPRQERPEGPERDYQPGGADCTPSRLKSLPSDEAPSERDRCTQAREEHRIEQNNLTQQVRSSDIAEGNLWLAVREARSEFIQTIATVAAFLAAAVAAFFAWRATIWTKAAARAAKQQSEMARKTHIAEHRPWIDIKSIESDGDIVQDAEGLRIPLKFNLLNAGRAPAKYVNVSMRGEYRLKLKGARGKMAGLAANATNSRTDRDAFILPNVPTPWRHNVLIRGTPQSLGDGEVDQISPVVYGLVRYETGLSDDENAHQSQFIFEILDDDAPLQMKNGELLRVPKRRVKIRPWPEGWYAD